MTPIQLEFSTQSLALKARAAILWCLLVSLPCVSVNAQDFYSIPYSTTMTGVLHKAKMRSIYGEDYKKKNTPEKKPTEKDDLIEFTYTPDPDVSKQVKTSFLAQLQNAEPEAAKTIREVVENHDVFNIYQQVTKPFGLKMYDPISSMTAYTMLGWLIATESPDPNKIQVQGVRKDLAVTLQNSLVGLAAEEVQAIDEELMYRFVLLHAGWKSAVEREGPMALKTFSEGVNDSWQKEFDMDLRVLKLTPFNGFKRK